MQARTCLLLSPTQGIDLYVVLVWGHPKHHLLDWRASSMLITERVRKSGVRNTPPGPLCVVVELEE